MKNEALIKRIEGMKKAMREQDSDNFHIRKDGTVNRTTFFSGKYEACDDIIKMLKEWK